MTNGSRLVKNLTTAVSDEKKDSQKFSLAKMGLGLDSIKVFLISNKALDLAFKVKNVFDVSRVFSFK